VARRILDDHAFLSAHTAILLAKIALVIEPTTVRVEQGFSQMGNVKTKIRNRLKGVNFDDHMMVKVNMRYTALAEDFLSECVEEYFKKERRLTNPPKPKGEIMLESDVDDDLVVALEEEKRNKWW
jgi:hypothetical protein